MVKGFRSSLAQGLLGLGVASTLASGQVVEQRDTKVTGPKGRTIERDITVKRGPGYVDRQVQIKRPGETIVRDTRIQTGPYGRPGIAPFNGGVPRFYGGPRYVENVIVQRPPVIGAFVGIPALSFAFGGGGAVVAPPPVVIPGPGVVPGPPPPPPVFDAFADAVGRLKSFHASSRRDGALTLGRMGDPRAVPALNERLEHDFDKDVRVAAAWALGEIGDERGAVALERAVLSEKRHHEVRDAAAEALKKLPKPGEVRVQAAPARVGSTVTTSPAPTVIQSRPSSEVDPGPTPPPIPSPADQPPPPPVPVPNLDRPINGDPSC